MANFPSLPGKLTAGDRRPNLTGRVPYDATGYTYTLTIKRPGDSELLVKAADVQAYDADAGTTAFTFAWEDGDLVAGDRQLCEVIEHDADGLAMTFPEFLINVKARNA